LRNISIAGAFGFRFSRAITTGEHNKILGNANIKKATYVVSKHVKEVLKGFFPTSIRFLKNSSSPSAVDEVTTDMIEEGITYWGYNHECISLKPLIFSFKFAEGGENTIRILVFRVRSKGAFLPGILI
jgi:hypothetical protein